MRRKKRAPECLKHHQFTTVPVCAVCNKLHKCKYYQHYYADNKERVIVEITKYVDKHKDKYEIGVWFMTKPVTEKKFLVFDQGKIIAQVTKEEAESMIIKNPNKYKNVLFLPVSQVMMPVITIKLTTKKMTDTQINKMIKPGK